MSRRGVLAFLGVQPSEGRTVALMTVHSFAMGWSTVLFETAASATFLARFPGSYLPWVYIAAAGVNTVTGTVYASVQRRVSFARLMKGTLWFLLAMVLSVRTGFAVSNVAWVAFAGLVSYRVLSSLTDLEYWAVASRIYDVRQAKRLFGLIGTGEVIARIVGAFSVPFLVAIGGVSNLMLLAAGALALCLVLVGLVLRGADDAPIAETQKAEAGAGIREIARTPYLKMVVGVAVLATFGKYFVDFSFLEEMSRLPKGEAQIASFIGIFNGVAQTLSLLTRLFVSRPLLHRFGIRAGVMVLPIAHALCAAVTVACGLFGASTATVFWLIIVNQGIYDTLKHPIDNASFKVLYQPLVAAQRLATQIAVEVIFSPVVVGVAGGVMLLFSAGMSYDPVVFSCVLLGNFVLWALFARAAGRGYQAKLVDNLKQRIEGNVALSFDDATSLKVLRSHLNSDSPAEVCVALHMLEKANAPDVIDTLVANIGHASPDVRRYALERVAELRPSALRTMRADISRDPNASVRRAGARAMRAVLDLQPYLLDADGVVRGAAVRALFDMRDDDARAAAIEATEGLAASARADDRILAARIAGREKLAHILVGLLRDDSFAVRRAALVAGGSEPLESRFRIDTDPVELRQIIDVYRSVRATAALRAHLDFPDAATRGRVLAALDALRYVAPERAEITALIESEAREAAWTIDVLRELDPALVDLRAALDRDVEAAAQRVFDLLAFIHDRVAVHRVVAHIGQGAKDKRAYAHEVLDLMLEPDERALVAPLLEDPPAQIAKPTRDTETLLRALIARDRRWLRSWPRSLARRALEKDGPPMLLIEKVIMLKTVPMFAHTDEDLLGEVAALFEEVEYKRGETIVVKGDKGESMYIVVSGRVQVCDGETLLSELGEKEIFGELALLDPQPRSASVVALDDARLFRLDGETFSQLMAGNVEIVRGVLHVLCERLRRTSATAGA